MRWALVAGDRRRTWKDVRAAPESIAAAKRLFYEVNLPFATAGPSPTPVLPQPYPSPPHWQFPLVSDRNWPLIES